MRQHLTKFLGAAAVLSAFMPFSASALTISRPTYDYSVNPGDTVLDVLNIYNESPEALTVYPTLKNFGPDDKENGEPQFTDVKETPAEGDLAQWVSIDTKPLTIAPNERKSLTFTINVPKESAAPGGHYGAILLATTPPSQKGQVGVASQLGALLLVNVSGNVTEAGSISQFGFKNPQVWYENLPIDFFLRFENSGNTHLRPTGSVVIEDMFGRKSADVIVNGAFASVLPRSIRRFEFGWHKKGFADAESGLVREWNNFGYGKYTATLVLNYGRSSNQIVTEQRVFYVWPWRIMLAVAIAGLVLLLLVWLTMRAHDRSVIRKYEKAKQAPPQKK